MWLCCRSSTPRAINVLSDDADEFVRLVVFARKSARQFPESAFVQDSSVGQRLPDLRRIKKLILSVIVDLFADLRIVFNHASRSSDKSSKLRIGELRAEECIDARDNLG